MGDVNRALGANGSPIPLPIGDKTYYMTPLTKRAQAEFETWLEERAVRAAQRFKDILDSTDYKASLEIVNQNIAEGYYSFGSEAYSRVIQTPPGVIKLLSIVLRPKHQEMTEENVEKLLEEHGEDVLTGFQRLLGSVEKKAETNLTESPPP